MSTTATGEKRRGRGSLLTLSLAALAAGLGLGLLGHASGSPAFGVLAEILKPVGDLWLSALLVVVLPLVLTQVLAAFTGARGAESAGGLGLKAVLLYVAMLLAAGLFGLLLAPPIIAGYRVDAASIASLHAALPTPQPEPPAAGSLSIGKWVGGLFPRNIFEAGARGDILALLLFTVLFAAAVSRLPEEFRAPLARVFHGLAQAMLLCAHWILSVTPLGVFALTYALGLKTGGQAASMLTAYIVIVCGLVLLFTALLYPVTAALGRTTMRAFARAVAPAQLVAVSTRSSIASLPALVEGGRKALNLPDSSLSFVLPLSVSVFKVNRPISSLVKLFFLGHVYGIHLQAGAVASFLAIESILSFTSAGVPLGGLTFKALPAYLAAGVPAEGVVILESVEAIPDVFKTLLNVTADMTAATLLSRSRRLLAGEAPTLSPSGKAAEETA